MFRVSSKFLQSSMKNGYRLSAKSVNLTRNQFKMSSTSHVTTVENSLPMYIALPTGITAGFTGALCGVGGGIVIIPLLKSATNMCMHSITATSILSVTAG